MEDVVLCAIITCSSYSASRSVLGVRLMMYMLIENCCKTATKHIFYRACIFGCLPKVNILHIPLDFNCWIVQFLIIAERKVSLGKDWHAGCLRCEKCNKTLTPGSHAEHEGKPYCNNPCYSALFGPGGTYIKQKTVTSLLLNKN